MLQDLFLPQPGECQSWLAFGWLTSSFPSTQHSHSPFLPFHPPTRSHATTAGHSERVVLGNFSQSPSFLLFLSIIRPHIKTLLLESRCFHCEQQNVICVNIFIFLELNYTPKHSILLQNSMPSTVPGT